METPKYLWSNNDSDFKGKVFIYLNENGEKIFGNTISDSSSVSPYSKSSVYKNATCSGRAVEFITSYDQTKSNNLIGLTDLSNNEYNIMSKHWNTKNLKE